MSNVCLKKPVRITLHYDEIDIVMETPPFFDKLFFEVDDKQLNNLNDAEILSDGG